ncbi:hypothetical protein [Burkholderia ubonensis]|uniref:hypothetical protein n=1 Tax=Burkholderia ubonensis TaxID=101571 RepID=UPI002AB2E137|nr:hypothetical protein [Burkholderia ubonensis]
MFDLKPVSTADLLTMIQTAAIVVGFYFSWQGLKSASETLRLGTRNAQAQLFNEMIIQGRELQFKFVDLFHGGDAAAVLQAKQDQFIGTLLGYYASCFEAQKMLKLPPEVTKLLDSDLKNLMAEERVRKKWESIRNNHSKEFAIHVESVRGV